MAATRIDCDIHPAVGGTRTTLLPYLDDHWKEQVVSRAIDGLDLNSYPPNMPFSGRADWRPAGKLGSGKPGSELGDGAARRVRPARFEPRDLQRASTARRRCSIPIWRPASARRSTTGSRPNGFQRIRGSRASIVVPMQAPDLAVEEIERRAGDNRFVSGAGAGAGRDACSDAGTTGRSGRPPRNTSCRSRSMPAAPIAVRRVRSAGRPIATNIIWPKRRRFRPRC